MARFSDAWLSELYAKNDIVDVVSGYTTLNERGGRFWGLCPFHNEKTPSFSVSRDKQLYYCFGCKVGGNVANFIMKVENVTFGEAVEMLAKRARIEMPQKLGDDQYRQIKEKRQQIYNMNKLAAKFYFDVLHGKSGQKAHAYLKKRGIEAGMITRFGLGYAPDSWESVTSLLRENGFSDSLIKESGLVTVKNNKMFDTFRDRVMFPIINVFGEVIAFGGRVMGDAVPKYLNTRDTLVFNKRRNLYGINLVRKMRGLKSVVLVEGYMDVVSLQAHGVKATVASLGTALTKQQAVLIKKYVPDVYIAYDGDEAGQIATLKALDILMAEGLHAHVIRFDAGLDPDDYIRKYGLGGFARKVKEAETPTGYRLEIRKKDFDLGTDDGREAYAVAGADIISKLESPIARERYIDRLAGETGFSADAITGQIASSSSPRNTNVNNRYNSIKNRNDDHVESVFLACAMANPQYIVDVASEKDTDDLVEKSHKNIFSAIYDSVKRGIQPSYAELLSKLDGEEDRNEAARLSELDIVADDPEEFLKDCIRRIRKHNIEQERRTLVEKLRGAPSGEKGKLLAQISKLDKELNQ